MSSNKARHRARTFALLGVYQGLLAGHPAHAIEMQFRDPAQVFSFDEGDPSIDARDFARADPELFASLLRGSLGNQAALDATLAPLLSRSVAELSPVEHAILLIATQELLHHPETPYRVVINEAIELAKRFGGTDGHRFVNGVLDRLAAQVREVEVTARDSERTPE